MKHIFKCGASNKFPKYPLRQLWRVAESARFWRHFLTANGHSPDDPWFSSEFTALNVQF